MALFTGLNDTQARYANAAFRNAFFPRNQSWVYPKIAATHYSRSATEPYSFFGAVPSMSAYGNGASLARIKTYNMTVPNQLFTDALEIPRQDQEFDQTRSLLNVVSALGARAGMLTEQLVMARILLGSTAAQATTSFEGKSFQLTMDGVSFFNQNHPGYLSTTQSNVLQGTLPNTVAAMLAQPVATTVQQLQTALAQAVTFFQTVKDDQGSILNPTVNPAQNIIMACGPEIEPFAMLAFTTNPENTVVNQTTNIFPRLIKGIAPTGYLSAGGYQNPFLPKGSNGMVQPLNPTDIYFFLESDIVKPLFVQTFSPIGEDQVVGAPTLGGAALDPVEAVMKFDTSLTPDQAKVYGAVEVSTTLGQVGANSSADVILNERFLANARVRMNAGYGFWPSACRVIPTGGTATN